MPPSGRIKKWVWALAAVWLLGLGPAARPAAALTNEEFLSLCAGEKGRADPLALRRALAAGADVNFTGPKGLTPLMAFVGAHRDADREALAGLRVLLAAGADLTARGEEGGTALSYAILRRSGPRFISALLAAGAPADGPVGPRGEVTALLLAAGLEPDPLVSALLLAAGASAEAPDLPRLADRNPNPRVARFLENARRAAPGRAEGLPLFAEVPADPALRAGLKEMDALARAPKGAETEMAWLDYLKWQIDLPLNVAARREIFGRTEAEAWLDEYAFYLTATADPAQGLPAERIPRDRIIIPGREPTPGADDAVAVNDRRVVILRYGRQLLVAYETATGRELWRRRPGGATHFFLVDRVLLTATPWGGGFGEAVVLDPLTGAPLLTLTGLDDPKWTVDAGRRAFIISTDYSLDIFDLASWKNRHWSWAELLDHLPWDEARRAARTRQNEILAQYGETLNDEGRFARHSQDLFQPNPAPGRAMLAKARASLKSRGYDFDLVPLAVERKNYRPPVFMLGPACPEICGRAEAATPLMLVNETRNRLDALIVPTKNGGRALTRGDLAASVPEDGRPRPPLEFSPGGALVAVTEATGDLHFFAAREQGRFLGTLPGRDRLGAEARAPEVKDLRLKAVLDDDLTGKPLVLFRNPKREDETILAEPDLTRGGSNARRIDLFHEAAGLTAFAVSRDDQLAVALADGGLWRIAPNKAGPVQAVEPGGPRWSALAFSGDGRLLAAAAGGDIHLLTSGQPARKVTLAAEAVSRLALDQSGRFLWAALEGYTDGPDRSPALALVDLSGATPPVYHKTGGRVLALRPDGPGGRAVAVVEAPPPPDEAEPRALGPPAVTRWAKGRADLIFFDQLRAVGSEGRGLYDRAMKFVGLAPDGSGLFHQEAPPDRPFVSLSREEAADRRTERLESYRPQGALGEAAFDASGRLAVFPEAGGGGFYIHNLATARQIAFQADRSGDTEGLLGAAFLKGGSRLVTFGRQGVLRLWDLRGAEPRQLLAWVFLEYGHWAAVRPDGLFDADQPESLKGLYWTTAKIPARTLALSHLAEDCLRPGLSAEILAGREPPPPWPPVPARDLDLPEVKRGAP
ncbi:MAG: hypothetical protein LBV21_05220 [Candidatus Adiutrix sp.]|jgi:hypothetical protein|nr:hypothetical protein [Candidatus Adiutrix sp.]